MMKFITQSAVAQWLMMPVLFVVLSASSGADPGKGSVPAGPLPELILQTGHSKTVQAVVFSPDNRWIASGSFDSTIRIWSIETGRELRSISGHQGAVTALACSPDGKMLVSGGNDDTVRLWDVARGTEIGKFGGSEKVTAVAFSSDGKRFAYGDSAGRITIRDVLAAKTAITLTGQSEEVTAVAFGPDSGVLASGGPDGVVRTWSIAGGKLSRSLMGHTGKVRALVFREDGVLASGSEDKTVRLWDWPKGRRLGVLPGHTGEVATVRFGSPGKLVSADSTGAIRHWKSGAKQAWTADTATDLKVPAGDAETAAFSLDGKLLAIGNGDGTVTIADAESAKKLETLENHTVGYYGVEFSRDGQWLAAAGFDNTVKLWDLRAGDSRPPLAGHTGRVTAVAFAPGNRVISASVDHTIRVWDLLTRKGIMVLRGHSNSISGLAVGRGRLAVSASADQTVGIWDLEGKETPRFLKGHTGEVVSVAISPDEHLIASSGIDGTIRLWEANSGTPLRIIDPRSGEVDTVAFSPDGKLLAAGGVDKLVRIWDVASGRLLQTLTGHVGKVNSVSFGPDGRSIASAAQDRTVRVWNVADGREISAIRAHDGPVFAASYSPNGLFLASASDDGSIAMWNAQNGNRIATLLSLKNSDDWLAVSPQGFFDGSSSAWDQLSWRFDGDTLNVKPVEVFFNEYYLPGLLSELLNEHALPAVSDISDRDRRQPQLRLTPADASQDGSFSTRTIKVKIDVASAPAGARDVRLFRNGSLVRIWRGDVLKGQNSARLEASFPIVAGDNRLTAYAFNNDNVKSSDASLTLHGASGLMRKGTLYVLAVGVNSYDNSEFDLRYAVADAQDFSDEIRRQQAALGNYERIKVISLRDSEARKDAVLGAIRDLSSKTEPEDGVIIYFAGHGVADQSRFYLVPHDLGYAGKRGDLDAAALQGIFANSISDEELEAAVREIDAGNLLLVIDACNSGQVLEAEEKRRGPMNSKGLAQLAYEKGMYILTAAQSYQAAQEAARLGHGFLTFALVEEGLKTDLADQEPKDGQVTLREWLDYATARVPQIRQDDLIARKLERERSNSPVEVIEQIVQRPRVFYRRETELHPLVVARP